MNLHRTLCLYLQSGISSSLQALNRFYSDIHLSVSRKDTWAGAPGLWLVSLSQFHQLHIWKEWREVRAIMVKKKKKKKLLSVAVACSCPANQFSVSALTIYLRVPSEQTVTQPTPSISMLIFSLMQVSERLKSLSLHYIIPFREWSSSFNFGHAMKISRFKW